MGREKDERTRARGIEGERERGNNRERKRAGGIGRDMNAYSLICTVASQAYRTQLKLLNICDTY